MSNTLFKDGCFFVGCNYWASHAGTNMWRDWQPHIIEKDMRLLAENNIKYLRIFPLWSDFQPLKMLIGCAGSEYELRLGETPLPFTKAGRAGVDIVMADRFEVFCDLAEKYGLKLVVGLVTGWMSGRLYVPRAFEHVNNLRDARSIKWQIKFVRYMVSRFKDHPAIQAWDLGNECNCLGRAGDTDGAYLWASAITMAINSVPRESVAELTADKPYSAAVLKENGTVMSTGDSVIKLVMKPNSAAVIELTQQS